MFINALAEKEFQGPSRSTRVTRVHGVARVFNLLRLTMDVLGLVVSG
jgi:hypothetical protein